MKKEIRRFVWVGAVVGFVGGLIFWSFWRSPGVATSTVEYREVVKPSLVTHSEKNTDDPRILDLERALQKERSVANAAVKTIQQLVDERNQESPEILEARKPIPFSATIPDRFQEKNVRDVAKATFEQCDLGLDLEKVDCSEYPCLISSRRAVYDGSVVLKTIDINSCGAWASGFGDDVLTPVKVNGEQVFFAVIGPDDFKKVNRRMDARFAKGLSDQGQ